MLADELLGAPNDPAPSATAAPWPSGDPALRRRAIEVVLNEARSQPAMQRFLAEYEDLVRERYGDLG